VSNDVVIDCSAIVDVLLSIEVDTARTFGGRQLHAPCVIDFEVVSTLRRLVRTNALAPNAARDVLDQWVALDIIRHPAEPLLIRTWDLRHNLSAYDAAYVALAEAMGAPLLTADKRMASAASRYCDVIV
jgi:predicted nucleic acid-binding protein